MRNWLFALVGSVALGTCTAQAGEMPCLECAAPITMEQACCDFKCLEPGKYEVTMIHPHTCCPVKVCFCLPCGCYELKCSDCLGTKMTFKYPGLFNDVVVKFKKDGSVVVKG
ncbi:hypothetical protein Pan216_36610 [Planctomycetes bacterium Pan216]|uniref:Uncharacterized protein n=1 Tax=Kolteria novifilia TaxID=2527975 RepID=A0A518B754_9BACT|nr:hypothetical protein Pan216_36610 [Planctomycetes bacterium Pan216]